MRVLVTGGAGFIGSHVADAYISAGHSVAAIDNLSTGSMKNLHPKTRFYRADIRNAKIVGRILRKERPAIINHHAAIALVRTSPQESLAVFETNTLGTLNLLLAASTCGLKKFIFASTGGALYGNPRFVPASEKTPLQPLSPYAISKLLAEELIKFYAQQHRFRYLIFRYANVYGPRQNPKGEAGVVAIFTELMRHKKHPVIYGDGTKTRDYVHVDDIARANLLGLGTGVNEALNIGTGEETSDQAVFDTIAAVLGYDGQPSYAPFRSGEVRRISLNNGRARRILGWNPRINFEAGIKRYIRGI